MNTKPPVVGRALATMFFISSVISADAMMAVNWTTPSGFMREDGATPLLEGGDALVQLVFSADDLSDPATEGGIPSGNDVVLAEEVATAADAGLAAQHFSAVHTNPFTPGYVFIRVFDTGTAPGLVPPGTAYFDGPRVALQDVTLPAYFQSVTEGAFGQGMALDGMGSYILDQHVAGDPPALPLLSITTADGSVANSVSNLLIEGTSTNLSGEISWSHQVFGPGGAVAAAGDWMFVTPLVEGDNIVTVSGSNLLGVVVSDTVTITRAAAAVPLLAVTPAVISNEVQLGASSTQYLEVANSGSGTLIYNMESDAPWLVVSPTNGNLGGGSTWHSLYMDAAWMAIGDYTGRVTVSANAPNAPQVVEVIMSVRDTSLNNALDTTNLYWSTGSGPLAWYYQPFSMVDGEDSAACHVDGYSGNNASVGTLVQGPVLVTFYWALQAQSPGDRVTVSVGGAEQPPFLMGTSGTQMQGVIVPDGHHTVEWTLRRDPFFLFGFPVMATLDQVMFRPAPALDITNTDWVVASDVTEVEIIGTNNDEIVGMLAWTNTLGGSGSLAADTGWAFMATLAVGSNVITVSGQNGSGFTMSDSVTVVRAGAPVMDITTPDQSVAAGVGQLTLDGTCNAHVVGSLVWSNSLGGSGSFAVAESWSVEVPLTVGTNVITVRGWNQAGESAADAVVITRASAGSGPWIDITNVNASAAYGLSNLTVRGVASNLNGQISWTNSLNGLAGTLNAATNWSFGCPLAVGTNLISVQGTNATGGIASDTLQWWRVRAPTLDVTNVNGVVAYAISNMALGGVSADLTGDMVWTNGLTGQSGHIAAANPFTIGGVALGEGTNLITVSGSNVYRDVVADGVTIIRGGPGTDEPLLDITNLDVTVGHTVSNWVIGGTANEHVVGQLSWTNSLGGKGSFAVSNTWSFLATLKSGTNVFTVSGTNLLAAASTDTVTIVRSNAPPATYVSVQWVSMAGFVKEDGVTPLFEGASLATFSLLMDVGPNGVVDPPDYCNTSQQVTHVVGGDDRILEWSSVPNEYAMGVHGGYTVQSTNALTVYARLMQDDMVAIGDRYFDGLPVTVQPQSLGLPPEMYDMTAPAIEPVMLDKVIAPCGGGSPVLDITNEDATVRYSVSNLVIGGTSTSVVGQLVWSNVANSLSGTAPAGATFSVGPIPLAVGTNFIIVWGTNATGGVNGDTVLITRGGLGTDLPLVDITNADASVGSAVSNRMIGGTANEHVVGQLRWTNSLGGSGGFSAAPAWTFMASLLAGTNVIEVRGSNYWGETSTDVVTIIRAAVPGSPLVNITNADASVSDTVSNVTVGGTATNVTGQLRWTNSLSGLAGTLSAGSTWSFTCPLAVGTNVITVTGTNGTGSAASDSLTMIRMPPAGVQSVYDLEADFRSDANLDNAVWSYRYQAGSLARDGNYELLPVFTPTNLGGIQGLSGWQKEGSLPLAGCNLTGQPLLGAFRIETGHSDVHPTDEELVVVSWLAPTTEVVRVQFQFADYDAGGGDGVWWYVARGATDLASGTLANGQTGAVVFLPSLSMTAGERLHFIVAPGPGGSGFDSTRIMARIELGAQTPQVQIATVDQQVEHASSNLLIEGTASNVTGSITWQNSLGGSGDVAAAADWSFVSSLGVGTNVIVVRGTNAWSDVAADTVTVVRLPYVAPGPQQVWTNVGSGVSGGAARCWDMAFTTNGELLIAGDFTSPGGHVALWNGAIWSNIGNMSQTANAVARDRDGRFVVGGSFITAGGVSANHIAAWNGSAWASLGTGLNGAPEDIVRGRDGNIYAAGVFTSAGGVSATNVARWNGTSWSAVGSGLGGVARALATDSAGNLYVGGDFTNAGAVAVQRIAKWNGVSWTNLGSGMNNSVHGLMVDGAGRLYAVGSFTTAGGVSAQRVAMWNGTVWTNLGSGLNAVSIGIVGDLDGNVYVGGDFTTAGGVAAQRVAKWDGSTWSSLGAGMNGSVYTLSIDEWGYLYAGGGFTSADGRTANGVARWNDPLTVSRPRLEVLGTNGAVLANNESPSAAKGTDFGLVPVGTAVTNRLAITNASSDALVISAVMVSGTGAASFSAPDMPASVAAGTRSNFTLVFLPQVAGVPSASVQIINDGPISPHVIQVQGTGVGSPALGISTPEQTVAHAVTQLTVGGTSANLAGHIVWSNEYTQLAGAIAAAGAWSAPDLALAVGTNVISVKGSNALGQVAADAVAITRVPAPWLDVTNASALVRYSTSNATVGGTSGNGVIGLLRWTNSLTGGSGVGAAASPFSVSGIVLGVGSNLITVLGTNAQGDLASDSVVITRGGLGTDLPLLDVTNASETVAHAVSNVTVGGTANAHVVGQVVWSNSLGGAGAFAASTSWSFLLPLGVGTNVVTVRSTNLWGESSQDAVTLIRSPAGPSNQPPYWTSTPVTTATAGRRYLYRLTAADPDGDVLSFLAPLLPAWLQLTRGSGEVSGTNIISTVAGSGIIGFTGDGGTATNARMNWPHGVALAADGALYITDQVNHRVRRVGTNGVITTVAGSGSTTYNGDGIAATGASLYNPNGVEVDAAGRIYIADLSHNRVRLVATNGVISTVAGTGAAAFSGDGGPATNAGLQAVADIALDAQGNLFVADMLNSRIRKVGTNGIITTVAGNGTWNSSGDGGAATNAGLNRPVGVTVDPQGNLYIADHYGHRIRKVGVDGVIRTVAGTGAGSYTGDGGYATNAAVFYPYDVALDDAGNLYIADNENHRVRKVSTNGIISTVAGRGSASYGGDGGAATNARINVPTDVAFDGAGNLYICDAGNQRIRMVAGGAGGWMLAGTPGPSDLGSTGIVVYVSDGTQQVPQFFTLTVGQLLAPTNLAAVAVGAGRIDLTWSDNNAEETGYVIERRMSTSAVWTVMASLSANSTSHSDMGLAAGQEYQYRIMAQNAEGNTAPSAVAFATTPGLPAAPGGLTASAISTSAIAVTWVDLSNNEQGFELQRRTGAAGSWSAIASLPADSVAWTDTGLLPNTLHTYRMRATNAAGVSAFSAEAGAHTPPATNDTDCGHLLVVTATNLLFDGVSVSPPATVPPATLVGGSLDCGQSSPRGAGTVHRVAMGFRDATGVAIGAAREVTLLYGTPGCPGRSVDDVAVPDGLRAPTNAGTYRLWIESYLSAADPRTVFASQVRTGETALARSLGSVVVQPRPPEQVEVRLLSANGLVSQTVSVPVLVSSTGGENAISFSVTYNTAVLTAPVVMSGADAPALWTIVNTGTAGRVGCMFLMPGDEVLAPGTKRVAEIVFRAIATGVSSIVFADAPVTRDVSLLDPEATPSVTWVGAGVAIRTSGYEGDLAPRPGGNQTVDEADRLLLQLIAAGLDSPADSNEFQKADCAPRATSGDGRINISDLRQLYRYASGFDPLQQAAGPWSATNEPAPPNAPAYAPRSPLSATGSRSVSLGDVATNRGDVVRLPVVLDAQGDESALGFSLAYDPELLTFVDMQLMGPATNANVAPAVQRAEEGVVGLALVWPANQVVPLGRHTVAELLFSSSAGGQAVTTTVVLGDEPMPKGVAGIDAGALPADFSVAATVSLLVADEAPGEPAAPSGLSAVAVATNQINLAWTDAASNENGYRLMRRTGAGAWTEMVTLSAGATTYEDVGLEPGTLYRYLVEAFNGAGARLGAEVSATTWTPMDAWRNALFGSTVASGATADAGDWDQDGLPNMIEYALGLDPRVDNYPMMPFAWQAQGGVVIGGVRFLTAEYELRPGAAGEMRVRMQVGGNLLADPVDMIPVDEVLSDGILRRRVRSDEPLGARGFEYLRMMVEPEQD